MGVTLDICSTLGIEPVDIDSLSNLVNGIESGTQAALTSSLGISEEAFLGLSWERSKDTSDSCTGEILNLDDAELVIYDVGLILVFSM